MRKIAILIGNDNYDDPNRKLNCAVNDATSLGDMLQKLNFDTSIYRDVDEKNFSRAMVEFSRKLPEYEVGLFFFAGHGFQIEGNNYLGCTDTSFADDVSMKHTAYPLQDILNDLQGSSLQVKILIIDACRTYMGARGGTDGFAPVFASKGTIIAFATSPGQTAKEKNGHGVFTKAILNHISTPSISIEELFKRVRNSVYLESSGSQVTWEHTSLMGKFAFNDFADKDNVTVYSKFALADAEYEPVSNGRCYDLIQDAKTINYNYQNTIPTNMNKWIREMYKESPDDIFVLGRNLYQASDNAYSIINYFEQLSVNLNSYEKEFANHLLAGMAFEIYFGSDGKLRQKYKTHHFYRDILLLLMSERYVDSKNFITSKLKEYSQPVVFIPGTQMHMIVRLRPEQGGDLYDEIYVVSEILVDGISVMYNREGTEPYCSDDDYRKYDVSDGIEKLNNTLLVAVAGTKRGVEIEYVKETGENVKDTIAVSVPVEFSLLRYSN